MEPMKSDNNKQLITLTVITLSGFHYYIVEQASTYRLRSSAVRAFSKASDYYKECCCYCYCQRKKERKPWSHQ